MISSVFLLIFISCGVLAEPKTQLEIKTECSKGPVFWCQNFETSRQCKATKHCIQTIWEHKKLEADNDDICSICKDMVTQARDQLESNVTQEELREVFEGSCKLIPVKIVREECIKLSDDFIPELVETLASQMNPQIVCATAGLCNSARIDKLLEEMKKNNESDMKYGVECANCNKVLNKARKHFATTRDHDILAKLLTICGRFGSLSTGCQELAIKYLDSITLYIRNFVKSDAACQMAGVCKAKYHEHAQLPVVVVPLSGVGVIKKDETCELCQQLVSHLRDVLVSNTTEAEFKDILVGLCKHSGSFKEQCLQVVDQYYPLIYKYLVDDLNPKLVCDFAGICHEEVSHKISWIEVPADKVDTKDSVKISEVKNIYNEKLAGTDEAASYKPALATVNIPQNGAVVKIVNEDERSSKESCVMCETFLHYVQNELTLPATEAKIKDVIMKACDHLPENIEKQCENFVEIYGDAFIVMFTQEIDPSQICPGLGLCPKPKKESTPAVRQTPCELCDTIFDQARRFDAGELRTKNTLNQYCDGLPFINRIACREIVETYGAMFTVLRYSTEDVCKNIKLCKRNQPMNEILTNEISQLPETRYMPQVVVGKFGDDTKCVICEFIMTQLDNTLKDNATEDEIKQAVLEVCNYLPNSVSKQCNAFVNQYADMVIDLLVRDLEPKAICEAMGLCPQKAEEILPKHTIASEAGCTLCLVIVKEMDKLLRDTDVEINIDKVLEKVCNFVPKDDQKKCREVIDAYGPSIAMLVAQLANNRDVCIDLNLCEGIKLRMLGSQKCTWGPGYWCKNEFTAMSCNATPHCQARVWKGSKPKRN